MKIIQSAVSFMSLPFVSLFRIDRLPSPRHDPKMGCVALPRRHNDLFGDGERDARPEVRQRPARHYVGSVSSILSSLIEGQDSAGKFYQSFRLRRYRLAMLRKLRTFVKDESAATAIEYGLIASGIALAIIPVITGLGTHLKTTFSTISSALK